MTDKSEKTMIRTRIAPSPTGHLHVGTARSALFNELFARQTGGQFILRIEDTDRARSTPEYEKTILEGLHWFGIRWDEGPDIGGPYGPYRQSERTARYREAIERLLASGKAYQQTGETAVRLRVEPQVITFTDLVRGEVSMPTDMWGGDFVIARAPDDPLYHLAVVMDDADMRISHVIRGEEHLSNTGRQILLQRALQLPQPQYAHLPLLLDDQRRKLSKRMGDVSLLSYRDRGYLPEAIMNYLALLGWHESGDREFFSHDELVANFSLSGIQKGGAVFALPKLNAMNKHYLREFSAADLLERTRSFLEKAGFDLTNAKYWKAAAATEQQRVTTLSDFPEALDFFRPDWEALYPPERLVWKKSTSPETSRWLQATAEKMQGLPESMFEAGQLQQELMGWIEEQQGDRGEVLWPLRVALTGREQSPGPFEAASVLGKDETIRRLKAALNKLGDINN